MGTILCDEESRARGVVVTVNPAALKPVLAHLKRFLSPYLPLFGKQETQDNAKRAVQGLLSDLPRKTAEPIAELHGRPRRGMQQFLGAGCWQDKQLIDLLVEEVRAELGSVDGVLIIDPSGFPKKGEESVGVSRQWCGRLGKVENCQVGVFLSYASRKGHTLVDYRLYLPQEWAKDKARREKCYVPKGVEFQRSWELGLEMVANRAASLPHRWILGDDEFGRVSQFRDLLAERDERYMLDVPSTTKVKILGQVPHPGRPPGPISVSNWAAGRPSRDWRVFTVRDGAKGPLQVRALWTRVMTRLDPSKRNSPWVRKETLVVIKTLGQNPETKYLLSNADETITFQEKVQAACTRWRVEDAIERAKGEVGLAQYEARSWTGWHHHMTLGLMALWFLVREHSRLRAAFPPCDSPATPPLHRGTTPSPTDT